VSARLARWATGLAVLAVAIIAAIVSYSHIQTDARPARDSGRSATGTRQAARLITRRRCPLRPSWAVSGRP
jgi:hypothetical protein